MAKQSKRKTDQRSPAEVVEASKGGRPTGSKTEKLIAEATPGRCPKCGSTARERYTDVRTMEITGTDPAGNPYNLIVWRRTRCSDCSQSRIDRFFENKSRKKEAG